MKRFKCTSVDVKNSMFIPGGIYQGYVERDNYLIVDALGHKRFVCRGELTFPLQATDHKTVLAHFKEL